MDKTPIAFTEVKVLAREHMSENLGSESQPPVYRAAHPADAQRLPPENAPLCLEVLRGINAASASGQSMREILAGVARTLSSVLQCQRLEIILSEPDPLRVVGAATLLGSTNSAIVYAATLREVKHLAADFRGGQMKLITCAAPHRARFTREKWLLRQGLRSYFGIPLLVHGNLVGALYGWYADPDPISPLYVESARIVASGLALAIENAELRNKVDTSREERSVTIRRLTTAIDNEKRALAREIHDEVGQALTALQWGLAAMEADIAEPELVALRVQELKGLVDAAAVDLHRVAEHLRPASLDQVGLLAALHHLVASVNQPGALEARFYVTDFGETRLAKELETTLYRVVQEALTNVQRHAGARRAGVILQRRMDQVIAIVEDDGMGFDIVAAAESGRLGLAGMQERAESLGGSLTIESSPGKGTTVFVELPYQASPEPPG